MALADLTEVVRPPQRPDQDYEVLYEAEEHADASRWLERYRQEAEAQERAEQERFEGQHPRDKG